MAHKLEFCEPEVATADEVGNVDADIPPNILDTTTCDELGPFERLQCELMQARELYDNSESEEKSQPSSSDRRPCADIEVPTCAIEVESSIGSAIGSLSEQMELTTYELIAASQRAAILLGELQVDSFDGNDSLDYSIDASGMSKKVGEADSGAKRNITNLERELLSNGSGIDALLSELSDARQVAEEAKQELSDVRSAMQDEIDELKRENFKTPKCGFGNKEWSVPTEVTAATTDDSSHGDLWQQEFLGHAQERELEEVSRDLSFETFRNDRSSCRRDEDDDPCAPCAFGFFLRLFQGNRLTKRNALA